MTTTQPTQPTQHETGIAADPKVPTIRIVRDFDAPRERVWRAMTDPALVVQWMGPRSLTMRITTWDLRRGGSWAYTASRDGEEFGFFGCFHDLREPERAVQTFTWEGEPDGVSLETLTLEELADGRTRATTLSVVESFEIRDAILASGMDTGVIEGYQRLDELLARDLG